MPLCLVGEWVSVGAAAAVSYGGEVLKVGGRVLDLDASCTLFREKSLCGLLGMSDVHSALESQVCCLDK